MGFHGCLVGSHSGAERNLGTKIIFVLTILFDLIRSPRVTRDIDDLKELFELLSAAIKNGFRTAASGFWYIWVDNRSGV